MIKGNLVLSACLKGRARKGFQFEKRVVKMEGLSSRTISSNK